MGVHYQQIQIPTSVGMETADTEADLYRNFLLPGKWLIRKVRWVPDIAVTANGTNYSVLTLTNATQTQTIGTRSYAATDSVAGTPETVTTPTGLAATLTDGDVLKLAKTTPGTGVAVRGRFELLVEQAPLP